MSTAASAQAHPTTIETGTVYIVTWADGVDPALVRDFTPMQARREDGTAICDSPSWLMIGSNLARFRDRLGRQPGADPSMLEFAPWTDLSSIADTFARAFGFPGRIGFDPMERGATIGGRDFGGKVTMVEADLMSGAEVIVKPLAIGEGWVGLVARVAPTTRVLAIPVSIAAIVTANMLGASCRRTRSDSLAVVASAARAAFPSMVALLSMRKASTGRPVLEARAIRLGELLEIESALLCPSLFDFAEVGGKAAISVAASGAWAH